MKAEGDQHSSSATIGRLQATMHGKDNDIKVLMSAKTEMEKRYS